MQEMYAAGWDMGNHSYSHVDLTTLTQAEAQSELEQDIQYLVSNGMPRGARYLGWPYSEFNDATIAAAQDAGIIAARTGNAGVSPHDLPNKLVLRRRAGANTLSIANMTAYIDEVIERGGVLIFNFHDIVNPADDTTDVLPATFQGVIDYLKIKQDYGYLDVVTFSEWYEGLTSRKPLVQARTAPTVQRMAIDNEARASLSFDGDGDKIIVPHNSSLSCASGLTIDLLVKFRENKTSSAIVTKYDGTNGYTMGTDGSGNLQYGVKLENSWDLQISEKPILNRWTRYTFVYDVTGKNRLYKNGVLLKEDDSTKESIGANTSDLGIAYNSQWGGGYGNLVIKNVSIISRALTPTEIRNLHYNNIAPSGAVLDLRLNEGAGATAYDSSGNGNNGTITGATWSDDTPTKARNLTA
jgi:hypothetical protein